MKKLYIFFIIACFFSVLIFAGWEEFGQGNFWTVNGSAISYSGGNLGIGTTSPGAALEIKETSDAYTSGLRIQNSGGTASLYIWQNSGQSTFNLDATSVFRFTGTSLRSLKPFKTDDALTVDGRIILHRTASATDYNPSALTEDYIIAITNTDAARAVTISTEDEDEGSTDNPRVMIVKDESGAAGTNNITITLESGGNIDGAANAVISTNYGTVRLYIDGTNAFTW